MLIHRTIVTSEKNGLIAQMLVNNVALSNQRMPRMTY